jgi:hypothetical protein
MAWTTPRTWVTSEIVTAAQLNTHLRDNLKTIGDVWTAYTPAWTATSTNPALGNGTMTGHYIAAGKWITFRIRLTMGSTTTYGTGASYSWTLPFTAVSAATGDPVGGSTLFDTSASSYFPQHAFLVNTTGVSLAYESGNRVSPSSPLAWATGDKINIQGCYEAA